MFKRKHDLTTSYSWLRPYVSTKSIRNRVFLTVDSVGKCICYIDVTRYLLVPDKISKTIRHCDVKLISISDRYGCCENYSVLRYGSNCFWVKQDLVDGNCVWSASLNFYFDSGRRATAINKTLQTVTSFHNEACDCSRAWRVIYAFNLYFKLIWRVYAEDVYHSQSPWCLIVRTSSATVKRYITSHTITCHRAVDVM